MTSIWLLMPLMLFSLVSGHEKASRSIYQPMELLQQLEKSAVYQDVDPQIMKLLPDVTLRDALKIRHQVGLSSECSKHLNMINTASTLSQLWALKVSDSWGKLGSGVLDGHTRFPGQYDECMNITDVYDVAGTMENITTNFCDASFSIYLVPQLRFTLGVCVPSQCNASDVWSIYKGVLQQQGIPFTQLATQCRNLDYSLPPSSITALFFVCLVAALCLFSTLFDWIWQLKKTFTARSSEGQAVEERTPLLPSVEGLIPSRGQDEGLWVKVLLALSIYSNASKVLNTQQSAAALPSLNGIRFISMTWVILGHTFMLISKILLDNGVFALDLIKRFTFSPVLMATVSVDTFFVLSGLLVAYLFLRDFHRRQITPVGFFKALPMIYLHRYLRLTPAYLFMIIIYTYLLYFVMDGPYWPNYLHPPTRTVDQNCVRHWYQNILYVNNLFNVDHQCAAWGWYLANDMQFFLVAPLFIYIFYRSGRVGTILLSLTIVSSNAVAIGVSHQQRRSFTLAPDAHLNFTPGVQHSLPYYFVPWCRYQTYGVGILAGCLLWKAKEMAWRIPPMWNVLLWGLSAGVCLSVVYAPYNANRGWHTVTLMESDAYNGLARTAWALGVAYVIISCSLGHGGWVNDFLSWKGFVPLGRLTYCAYLVHIPVIYTMFYGLRNGSYFTNTSVAGAVILAVTTSYLVAFVFSLLFEAPFINLDRLFLTPLSIRMGRDNAQPTTESLSSSNPQANLTTDAIS